MDCLVLAVAHDAFKAFSRNSIDRFYRDGRKILLDLKGILDRKEFEDAGYLYWRL